MPIPIGSTLDHDLSNAGDDGDMTDERTADLYLRDLGILVAEQARQARADRDADPKDSFALGRLTGWHEIVSLMQQQAEAFGLAVEDVGLGGIDPERDLL